MVIQESMDIKDKLKILSDSAKYDVACISSGSQRDGGTGSMGNTVACGICHSFSADGRCISLLKILFTNECIFDCRYCINRRSNDVVRASFTPDEVCSLTMEFYRRNYIEGLFLSSGIIVSPTHTMTLLTETVQKLRLVHHFNGYIHLKAIPGADPSVIEEAGWYADRMSVNLELPTADGLKRLAPNKTRKTILAPMRQIQYGIRRNQFLLADYHSAPMNELTDMADMAQTAYDYRSAPANDLKDTAETSYANYPTPNTPSATNNTCPNSARTHNARDGFPIVDELQGGIPFLATRNGLSDDLPFSAIRNGLNDDLPFSAIRNGLSNDLPFSVSRAYTGPKSFVPAGQSTQMIIGATPESDYHLVTVAEALYNNYNLKRVFYSAFVNVNHDSSLPSTENGPPLLREHRLYQADWLLRFYGFRADELLSEEHPNFNTLIDPKCDWAIGHLDNFPVEINTAGRAELLRVPGIGPRSVNRIIAARRSCRLDFPDIRRMGVVMKRARYFITCNGHTDGFIKLDEDYIISRLISADRRKVLDINGQGMYRQISLFDTNNENFAPLT